MEASSQNVRAIVIAVDSARGVFAIETADGRCAVFCQHVGSAVQAGDMVEGDVLSRGNQKLAHGAGICSAVGDGGPVTRNEALARVRTLHHAG